MKAWYIALALMLSVSILAACASREPTAAPVDAGLGDNYTSEALHSSYEDALNASSQLVLGTLRLEGSKNAVTVEQAKALLPLCQALEGGGLQSEAERSAVLRQIEGEMSSEQLQAISTMRLSPVNMRTFAEEQGLAMGLGAGKEQSPDALATRGAQSSGGDVPPEMSRRRAEMQGTSEEQREAFRATAQAGGAFGRHPGADGGGSGQPLFLLKPLIELLEARAAE